MLRIDASRGGFNPAPVMLKVSPVKVLPPPPPKPATPPPPQFTKPIAPNVREFIPEVVTSNPVIKTALPVAGVKKEEINVPVGTFGVTKTEPMGWLSDIAAKVAKTVVPKILVGGDRDDRKAVQTVVSSGVADDPVFKKFGDRLEDTAKVAGTVATVALPALGKIFNSGSGPMSVAAGPAEQSGGYASGSMPSDNKLPTWVYILAAIGLFFMFGKKLLR